MKKLTVVLLGVIALNLTFITSIELLIVDAHAQQPVSVQNFRRLERNVTRMILGCINGSTINDERISAHCQNGEAQDGQPTVISLRRNNLHVVRDAIVKRVLFCFDGSTVTNNTISTYCR